MGRHRWVSTPSWEQQAAASLGRPPRTRHRLGTVLLRRKRRVQKLLSTALLGAPPDILQVEQVRTRRRKLGRLKSLVRWYDLMGRVSKQKLKENRSNANATGPSRSHFSIIFIVHVLNFDTVANSGGPRKRKKSGTSPKRLTKEDRQAQQRKVAAAGAYNTRLSLAFYSICVCVRATYRKVVVLCLLCLLIDIDTEMKVG